MSSTLNHAQLIANSQSNNESSRKQVVINTRPVERAAALTDHLQAAGLTVVEIPMLTLQPRPTIEQDMTLMRQWLAGDYKALVIVSPTAAASGLAVWQALEDERQAQNHDDDNNNERKDIAINALQAPSYLIAVGEATASVLNNAKIEASNYQVLQPHIANNEGMLAMPEIERLQAGDKLLVWRGLGGRRLLVDTLLARGVHIDSIAWYERIMPVEAMDQYEQWLQGVLARNGMQDTSASQPKPIVVVSSGTAFEHWESIVRAVAEKALNQETARENPAILPYKLSDFSYVVLGERLANMVAEQQLSYWRVEDLAPETILAAIHAKAC
ncbi:MULTISPECIES: uroporphyrinogen-III synthase [unclassified Psychrobacter]|uniref:uroporphyrinogen-III synthase n=1 Tax=unclassified Psychrobacter TaxID=196806 RepID=UPI000EE8228C|nr:MULTISPECIES: uroporphyrinogen-III synthase [unclassified Psychrobacter]MBE8609962.1 uroporphyrinogen-III synthase [Pseudomonas lundensis]HCI76035.1 uroporphyrinogen-III synthase [Psychrobacter sp.]